MNQFIMINKRNNVSNSLPKKLLSYILQFVICSERKNKTKRIIIFFLLEVFKDSDVLQMSIFNVDYDQKRLII